MGGKFHTKEYKDDALALWDLNLDLPKGEKLTQVNCAAWISQTLGMTVSAKTICGWKRGVCYVEGKKGVLRGEYKAKKIEAMGKDYDELVEFCDELLIDENKMRKENIKLINEVKKLRAEIERK
jgi:hypothetical protein